MTSDERIETLFSIVETQTKALLDTQLSLTAMHTAFMGVLQALDDQADLVPLIAKNISAQSEKLEAIYLGSPVSEEMFERRTQVLRDLLPPNLRRLVVLQRPL